MSKTPIDVMNFSQLVQGGYYFVDKTLFIPELLRPGIMVNNILRPPGWGKTLTLSMLEHFLASEVNGQKTQSLFTDLKINRKDDNFMKHQGQYPVISLSFSDINADNFEKACQQISELIKKTYQQYDYLESTISSNFPWDKDKFMLILEGTTDILTLKFSLVDLTNFLYQHHQKSVYVLIDDYDIPLLHAYRHGYLDKMQDFLLSFCGMALKGNNAVEQAILMGVIRFPQDDYLGGRMNHICVDILDSVHLYEAFGFAETEILELLKVNQLPIEIMDIIKIKCGGYQSRPNNKVLYNPNYVMRCLATQGEGDFKTELNIFDQLIQECIRKSVQKNRDIDYWKSLLHQKVEVVNIDEHTTYQKIANRESSYWSLLWFTGVVNALLQNPTEDYFHRRYDVTIPNQPEIFRFQKIMDQIENR